MPTIHPGPMGSSAPVVPVRDAAGKALPVDMVRAYLMLAVAYAKDRPDQLFTVQRDGWGHSFRDLVSVFKGGPGNIMLPYGEHI